MMLDIFAGDIAIKRLQEEGFKPDLFDHFLGASGGPKWFSLFALDKYLFGDFFKSKKHSLHLIGSSAGAFRAACLTQKKPVSAITRLAHNYVHTVYSDKPSAPEISHKAALLIDQLFAEQGVEDCLNNKQFIPHFLVNKASGYAASNKKWLQTLGMSKSLLMNRISRKNLQSQYQRHLFTTEFSKISINDSLFDTHYHTLTESNIKQALLASGSIPMIMERVTDIDGAPKGHYWDGGIIDYHFDFKILPQNGLTLYPHFHSRPSPGWFDKYSGRVAKKQNYENIVMLVPSEKFIQQLPNKKIPDRKDFTELTSLQRIKNWETVLSASEQLAEELHELLNNGKLARSVHRLPF